MNKVDKNLADILDTEYYEIDEAGEEKPAKDVIAVDPPAEQQVVSTPADSAPDLVEVDAGFVRSQLYGLIETGNDALERISEIAKDSMHPRAYEVIGQLMKTQSDNLDKLLKLQKEKKEIQKMEKGSQEQPQAGGVNINNAIVFSGPTTELLKRLKDTK